MRMFVYILIILLVAGLGYLAIFSNAVRMVQSLYLIASVTPYERELKGAPTILVLGDSTGYGTGANESEATIAGRIGADFPQYSIINQSKNGRIIEQLKADLATLIKEADYELILLQIGANDVLQARDPEIVSAELTAIFLILKERTPHIIMMSSGNIGGAPAFKGEEAKALTARSRIFREMFIKTAAETGVTYVDLFKEPADDLFIIEADKYMAIDGLHPTGAGYALWYELLRPILKTKLDT